MAQGLDDFDRSILSGLQQDANVSVAELGERVHLSQNACWRRIKRLEQDGYIKKRVALLDQVKMGVGVTVFVTVKAAEHSEAWLKVFSETVSRMPEVTEIYRLSGDIDYLMKLVVPDIQTYDAVYKRLIGAVRLTDVSSSFAMEEIKSTTAIPVTYAD
jgi:Lrp/AsnC family transcriptional regulator